MKHPQRETDLADPESYPPSEPPYPPLLLPDLAVDPESYPPLSCSVWASRG
eukprot:CAMPEP_0183771996 /NCGR_PEP_ID=MMETSP0739-20130205/34572_1 /TAXON_ID=385413 /ORGANISM="Thalassiosira miniscula, Strain CCMP1093" /LENGTH=50 /DNA_ID=CAMNT_0026012575 /DNA_START=57 /DNA_END=206 /DNA_ORIENTATION=+